MAPILDLVKVITHFDSDALTISLIGVLKATTGSNTSDSEGSSGSSIVVSWC